MSVPPFLLRYQVVLKKKKMPPQIDKTPGGLEGVPAPGWWVLCASEAVDWFQCPREACVRHRLTQTPQFAQVTPVSHSPVLRTEIW